MEADIFRRQRCRRSRCALARLLLRLLSRGHSRLFLGLASGPLLGALFSFTCSLGAQAPVSILAVDQSLYPEINLRINSRSPHIGPSFSRPPSNTQFTVAEIYNDQEYNIEFLNVRALQLEAERLNIVLLADTTRSIAPQGFQRLLKNLRFIVNGLRPQDRMAIYSVRDRPLLLSDFSNDQAQLGQVIRSLKRDGEVTRIYDALYSGIYTARSLHESDTIIENDTIIPARDRTIVLLMTDGREESSYLNDQDCLELTRIGQQLHIPIYVSLLSGRAKGGESSSGNHRLLRRLALRTGGSLYEHLTLPRIAELLPRWRQLPQPLHEIGYRSRVAQEILPGERVEVRLTMQVGEGRYSSSAFYRAPWFSLSYLKSRQAALWPALLAIAAGLFLLLLFLLFRQRRHRTRKQLQTELDREQSSLISEEREADTPDATAAFEAYPQERSAKSRLADRLADRSTDRPREDREDMTDLYDSRQAFYRPIGRSEPGLGEPAFGEPGLLMEDERLLYMRQYGYRMLQLALRNARPYRHAALITENAPRKRTYDLFLDNTLIGSGRWAHIPIYDTTASPVHARIRKVDERYVIYDLLSASGIYLNDSKLLRPRALRHGDQLRIGRSLFLFEGRQ